MICSKTRASLCSFGWDIQSGLFLRVSMLDPCTPPRVVPLPHIWRNAVPVPVCMFVCYWPCSGFVTLWSSRLSIAQRGPGWVQVKLPEPAQFFTFTGAKSKNCGAAGAHGLGRAQAAQAISQAWRCNGSIGGWWDSKGEPPSNCSDLPRNLFQLCSKTMPTVGNFWKNFLLIFQVLANVSHTAARLPVLQILRRPLQILW